MNEELLEKLLAKHMEIRDSDTEKARVADYAVHLYGCWLNGGGQLLSDELRKDPAAIFVHQAIALIDKVEELVK